MERKGNWGRPAATGIGKSRGKFELGRRVLGRHLKFRNGESRFLKINRFIYFIKIPQMDGMASIEEFGLNQH